MTTSALHACVFALSLALLSGAAPPAAHGDAPAPAEVGGEGRASLYVRADSDRTTVISPRVRYRQSLRTPRRVVDITYSLDAWSSASVDIRSAATGRVSEVRHEVEGGYSEEIGAGAIAAGYRLSYEPDYTSHAVHLRGQRDLLQRTLTLSARLFGSVDQIGRAGDENFAERALSGGALLSAGLVLTRTTLAVVAYELRGIGGYQGSPYRYVALGGDGLCSASAALCVPEEVPRLRARHAFVGQVRQALGRWLALGGLYRFYADSWALRSHTFALAADSQVRPGVLVGLEYRAYAQSGASFYRARYPYPAPGLRFFTRDRELSSLGNHRLALRGAYRRPLRRGRLEVGGLIAGSRLEYDDFIGLDEVYALELSLSLGGAF
jgi:hypothetical protein